MSNILNTIIVFIVKVIDNELSTAKTILIQKNHAIFASLTVIISNIIFYKLIDAVNDGGEFTIYVIAFASGLGTYIALKTADRFSKERTFVNVILSDNKKEMGKLRDFLRDHKITNLATECFTKDWKKTIAITAYAETKYESKLIDNYINSRDIKFKRIIDVKR